MGFERFSLDLCDDTFGKLAAANPWETYDANRQGKVLVRAAAPPCESDTSSVPGLYGVRVRQKGSRVQLQAGVVADLLVYHQLVRCLLLLLER